MKHDPISDVLNFLQQPAFVSGPTWPTAVFWVLVLASLAIAVYAFAAMPGQRRATHLWNWVFRFLIGCMWWQQTLWKLPPYYTDHPDQPFGATGLAYLDGVNGQVCGNSTAGRVRQQHRVAAFLRVRAGRLFA